MSEIIVPDYDGLAFDQLRLFRPEQVNRSSWSGGRKVIGAPGRELWRGKVTIDPIATEVEERPWRAFLFNLGMADWFKWMLPCNTHIGPKPVVGSSPGNGYTLPLSGMQPNTMILRAGQFMTVPLPSGHARAVCLTADLVSNGSGQATAQFRPALGEVPSVGATVETSDPFIPMSPVNPELGLSLDNGISGTSFDVEEAR